MKFQGRRTVATLCVGYMMLQLAQIGHQQLAPLALEAADGLLLDLAHAFTCEVELCADLLKRHLLTSDAKEHLDDVALARGELLQHACHLGGQRFLVERRIGER